MDQSIFRAISWGNLEILTKNIILHLENVGKKLYGQQIQGGINFEKKMAVVAAFELSSPNIKYPNTHWPTRGLQTLKKIKNYEMFIICNLGWQRISRRGIYCSGQNQGDTYLPSMYGDLITV